MLESLTCAQFSEWVGSAFRFHYGAEPPMVVELVEAKSLGTPGTAARGGRDPFSLVFRGPTTFRVPQKIYKLEHDALGALEFFLVPIGPDDRGMRYQAIFT